MSKHWRPGKSIFISVWAKWDDSNFGENINACWWWKIPPSFQANNQSVCFQKDLFCTFKCQIIWSSQNYMVSKTRVLWEKIIRFLTKQYWKESMWTLKGWKKEEKGKQIQHSLTLEISWILSQESGCFEHKPDFVLPIFMAKLDRQYWMVNQTFECQGCAFKFTLCLKVFLWY